MALRKITFADKIRHFEGRLGRVISWPGRQDAGGLRVRTRRHFRGPARRPHESGNWATEMASRPGPWASKFRPQTGKPRNSLDPGAEKGEKFSGKGLCGLNLMPMVKAKIFFARPVPFSRFPAPRSAFRVPRPSLLGSCLCFLYSCPWLLTTGYWLLLYCCCSGGVV